MVDQTNAVLAATHAAVAGAAFRPAAPRYSELTGEALRGVTHAELVERSQMVLNYTLSAGGSLAEAVRAGGNRTRSIAATNLQLTQTNTVARGGRAPYSRQPEEPLNGTEGGR